MKTVVVQIGNSDDKLTQEEWSQFQSEVSRAVCLSADQVHFTGYSAPTVPWQNMCIVAVMSGDDQIYLQKKLIALAKQYRQDSIAVTSGLTEFVG